MRAVVYALFYFVSLNLGPQVDQLQDVDVEVGAFVHLGVRMSSLEQHMDVGSFALGDRR